MPTSPAHPFRSFESRALLLILLTSLALKLALAWTVRDMGCQADECDYLLLAQRLAFGEGFQEIGGYLWPPGYVGFLAGCLELFGPHRLAPRLVQVLLSTVTVLAVFGIGKRLYDGRTALVAAAMVAFYPNLVAFSHLLWSETLYIFASMLAIALLLRRDPPGWADAAGAGVCFGVAALVRSLGLYVGIVAGLWLLWGARRRPRQAALAGVLLAGLLLPVLPWTVRNAIHYERLCPIDATTGQNLYLGTNLGRPASWDHGMPRPTYTEPDWRPFCRMDNVIDRDRCEVGAALRFMGEHPGLTLRRVPTKLADLLTPGSFAIRHARIGKYAGAASPGAVRAITLAAAGAWMLLAILAAAGLLLRPGARGSALIWCVVGLTLAIHALTFGTSRFRLPLVPLLALPAAALLAHPGRIREVDHRWPRVAAVAAGIGLLIAAFAARWQGVFDVF